MNEINYGKVTAPVIGAVVRDRITRAMRQIWELRNSAEIHAKTVDYKKDKNDIYTDADVAVQESLIAGLSECFPEYGIIAEEGQYNKKWSSPDCHMWFTIDSLDGTKAYARKQSFGFGPMIALVKDGRVIGAWVGDVMSWELYYFRPESPKVHRLNILRPDQELLIADGIRKLSDSYILFRDSILEMPEYMKPLYLSSSLGGIFKSLEILGGGIGSGMARLWKGEVAAYVINAGAQKPWDYMPVIGMNEKLGFLHLTCSPGGVVPIDPLAGMADPMLWGQDLQWNWPVVVTHAANAKEISDKMNEYLN